MEEIKKLARICDITKKGINEEVEVDEVEEVEMSEADKREQREIDAFEDDRQSNWD